MSSRFFRVNRGSNDTCPIEAFVKDAKSSQANKVRKAVTETQFSCSICIAWLHRLLIGGARRCPCLGHDSLAKSLNTEVESPLLRAMALDSWNVSPSFSLGSSDPILDLSWRWILDQVEERTRYRAVVLPRDYGDVNVSPSEPFLGEKLVPQRGDPVPSTEVKYISEVTTQLMNEIN